MITEEIFDGAPPAERDAPIPDGWLPIDFVVRRSGIAVRWMEFGTARMTDPFFSMTLERLRSSPFLAREVDTDLTPVLLKAAALPPVRPAGMIFHVSRCGSTLLSNVLRTAQNALILSEARPIGVFLQPHIFRFLTQFEPNEREKARRLLLDCILTIYGNHHGVGARPVVKGNGTDMLYMQVMRRVWPDVPCIVLVRDPVEVIVSVLDRPAGWLDLRRDLRRAARTLGWVPSELETMSAEEYCARVIGRFCEAAAPLVGEKCRVVDYSSLNAGMIRNIAEFFRLDLPADDSPDLLAAMDVYSKDPGAVAVFQPDVQRKQREVTRALRALVDQWAEPHYQALRRLEVPWPGHERSRAGVSSG